VCETNFIRCVPCPPGSYIVVENRTCVHCPPQTYLNSTATPGPNACVKCGNNLKSTDGVECVTDCRTYQVNGVEIFSRDGSRYLHVFNMSFCSSTRVSCSSSPELQIVGGNDQESVVKGLLCKITSIPRSDENLYANPLVLGERIVSISDQPSFEQVNVSKDVFSAWEFPQVYFLYHYSAVSRSCVNGFHTVVVFRCDPSANETRVELPTACPDGTCDGCLYYIFVYSRQACPVCGPDDYEEIVEACRNGVQLVHFIPSK
ncbi:unnamed protein product, partial [Soboliphyme baturini]|uniref:MRH domain-containing protein n=1 Tax=Soboliphyme baturini TaxID=241478 RepID=A0A183J6B7_9BILA